MLKHSFLYTLITRDKAGRYVLAAIITVAFLVPLLNLVMPPNSFFHVPTYTVTLLGKYFCYALLALALDLV